MIAEFLRLAREPAAEPDLRKLVAEHVRALLASEHGGNRGLVERAETIVGADPAGGLLFDSSGLATLRAFGATWSAGRFETPSIGDLRARVSAGIGEARLWVFEGASPATDIGALQATADGRPLFQVASQFNCLESPGPSVVPVSRYFSDPTQGPRAAISAFPGTLMRHYRAPGGDHGQRFVQKTDGPQIDLLAELFAPDRSPVRNGYLRAGDVSGDVAAALEEQFDRIRVGVQDEVSVVLGYNWDGAVEDAEQRRIAQTFTSTAAAGMYGDRDRTGFELACRQLLRAAYLGTLLAAISLRRSPVVLTLIGGGVFGNRHNLIWEAIISAFDELKPYATETLDVIVNGRNLQTGLQPEAIATAVRRRNGAVLKFGANGLTRIDR